ncbi:hypothetical protein CLTEP_04470 [Clostridium tepidiprofundi DSM 19306]|uniref:Uncharacterized protein n=1 Tax=Clostridium tepidiprofundi DSM 19306 TaxID=1121338 RepID=A0A151B6F4_9CLOT|nr:hypothetical protein CLTEP_04470 [Clostridium tepidiprofundi DSM 19306]
MIVLWLIYIVGIFLIKRFISHEKPCEIARFAYTCKILRIVQLYKRKYEFYKLISICDLITCGCAC